jgi:hypothetical protein
MYLRTYPYLETAKVTRMGSSLIARPVLTIKLNYLIRIMRSEGKALRIVVRLLKHIVQNL